MCPFRWLNTDNLAAGPGRKAHVFLDKEELLRLDPEVIFVDGGGLVLVSGDYAKNPKYYDSLGAFRSGRVHLLHPFNWYTTNLGTMLADSYAMGKVCCTPRGLPTLTRRPRRGRDIHLPAGPAGARGHGEVLRTTGRQAPLPGAGQAVNRNKAAFFDEQVSAPWAAR